MRLPCLGAAFEKSTTLISGCFVMLLLKALYSLTVLNLSILSISFIYYLNQSYYFIQRLSINRFSISKNGTNIRNLYPIQANKRPQLCAVKYHPCKQ
jgi:hypothetical protein